MAHSPLMSASPFIRDLMLALGLPKNTTEFTLTAKIDEMVTVDAKYFVDVPDKKCADIVTSHRFHLVPEKVKE